jgi:nitronate monooxygenase
MSLDAKLKSVMVLPAVCAPMTMVSGPALVREACKSGIMAGLPRHNARTREEFESWLAAIRASLDAFAAQHPRARVGPLAVNIVGRPEPGELRADLAICAKYGVEIIISALGNPAELTRIVHDWGGKVFHDVTTLRFAAKAIEGGVDGLTCIGSGGGGHSGTMNALAFIPRVRELWDGTIIFAGSVSSGAAIRAAEILGADLAYLGTRFIATQESLAPDAYKDFLVRDGSSDLIYTERVTGVAASWLKASLRHVGLDPDNLPVPSAVRRYCHLPAGIRPWREIWSAGQGIDLIRDIPSVADLVLRLRREYVAACAVPDAADAALVEVAMEAKGTQS